MKIWIKIILIMMFTCSLFATDFNSFAEFQTHIKNESQRVSNVELHKQIRNTRESREYELGDPHIYWRYDLSVMPPGWVQIQATCQAVGEHCYVFVADDEWQVHMDEADVQEIFNYLEFETMNGDDYGVVEMDTLHFGEMPDELDNDPRLIVFYSALGSFGGSTFDGYFSSYDQVTEAEAQQMNPPGHSNECEMIYMTCHPLNPTEPVRISVLAHELQHLIHWGGDINEETWVNEGLSELAMVYFGMPDPISQFNSNPDNSLNTWNQEWADYVKTLLFFTYFAEQFDDGTIIKDIVSEPLNSISGISNQLIEHGYTIPFEAIFNNWTVANYLDDPDIAQGQYNYENLELPGFNPTHYHSSYPASGNGTTNPWATDYIRLLPDEPNYSLHLEVNHPLNLGVIRKSDDVVSTVDFYIVNDVLDLDLPEMTDEYDQMILVIPNSDNSDLIYSYEITGYVSTQNYELEITNYGLTNYPNPFNPSTTISFNISNQQNERVELKIYNLKGQKIKNFDVILSGVEGESNSIYWDGTDQIGKSVSSGIYYYKLVVDNKIIDTKKMMLMK
ncbi:MAG: T9SS type A sorting domain-containing protein [Candidatus Tenebribacter davisii]|jgi:hypothetical protein|nr:T9SS type A sorting domain-containing protein [Candidatus Tenebribacter davisii]